MSKLFNTYDHGGTDSSLFLLDLEHFKIEYVPYNDVNGHNIVDIECFCDESEQSNKYKEASFPIDH